MVSLVIMYLLIGSLFLVVFSPRAAAVDGGPLGHRAHLGRVKAVDPGGRRLIVEGMFHDRSFREIPVEIEVDAPIINPDLMNPARRVGRGEIRPGDYVALDCAETGKRHVARQVTITSTQQEETLFRGTLRRSGAPPPGLSGTGGGSR